MRKRMTTALAVLATLALALTALLASRPAAAASVTPDVVGGNPSCTQLGYALGYKPQPEPPPSGSYPFPGTLETVTITSDDTYFDWSSTLGLDAVIVKGGSDSNVYRYDPPAESFGDTGLHSPINPNNGRPFDISHIEFCYDFELTATKTADAKFTRTYSWTIAKSVEPAAHSGFAGDAFSSDYAVNVDQTVTDSDFSVDGTITVVNPSPFTVGFSVSDSVGGTAATVSCPTYSLGAGASTTCTYSADFGDTNPGDGTNTATITSNTAGVGGATASDGYAFGAPTTTVGDPTVSVSDSVQGLLGSTSGDHTFSYSDEFVCPSDPSVYDDGVYTESFPNTASIDETGQTADAGVSLTCYAPVVSKTASTSLTRTWTWTIEKVGDQSDLTLSTGQSFLVNYDVTVGATSADSAWAVNGTITVDNPNPDEAMTVFLADIVSPDIAATLLCDPTLVVPAGGSASCGYTASLPDAGERTNTATAVLNGINFSFTANVSFANPSVGEIDECITVTDDKYGALGTVCAGDASRTFTYSLDAGSHATCGDYTFVNTASFVANDTGATGSDGHSVSVKVPCAGGCTLTQGYWKTHSEFGPAPYDDTWALLPNGASTTFFNSGKTWYQVFWTPPAGNAYYNLAHQYMAAKLNVLNGASTAADVDAALAAAENFFNTKTPSSSLSKTERSNVLKWASTLDKYNNGLIGPGHCDE